MLGTSPRIEDLFAPLSPATFAADYWAHKPLYIKGTTAKLVALFGRVPTYDDILAIVARAKAAPTAIAAFFQNPRALDQVDVADDLPRMNATADQVPALLAAGATVAVYRVDDIDTTLARWTGLLRAELQHAGETTCALWLSSPKLGMYTHYDAVSTLHVQLSGTKTWRVSPTAHVVAPPGAAIVRADGLADVDITGFAPRYERIASDEHSRFVLEPGDVLYVPSGAWHATECNGDAISVSCAFELRHASFRDLIAAYLTDHFAADPRWRHLPIARRGDPAAEAEVATYFTARLEEAIAALEDIRERRFELANAWQRLVADNGAVVRRPPKPAGGVIAIAPDDVLAQPAGKPLTTCAGEQDGSPVRFVYQAGEVVCFDDPALFEFATHLALTEAFTARDACGWSAAEPYPWHLVCELLESLVATGILEKRARASDIGL